MGKNQPRYRDLPCEIIQRQTDGRYRCRAHRFELGFSRVCPRGPGGRLYVRPNSLEEALGDE